MTYSEKLKDPRWQKKRLEILERDGWACCHCQEKNETLHVHHHWYEKGKAPWDYPDTAFETLCKDCHGKVERWLGEMRKELSRNARAIMDGAPPSWAIAETLRCRPFQEAIGWMWQIIYPTMNIDNYCSELHEDPSHKELLKRMGSEFFEAIAALNAQRACDKIIEGSKLMSHGQFADWACFLDGCDDEEGGEDE